MQFGPGACRWMNAGKTVESLAAASVWSRDWPPKCLSLPYTRSKARSWENDSLYCRALASKAVLTLMYLPSLLREYMKVVEGRGYKESVLQTHETLFLHL